MKNMSSTFRHGEIIASIIAYSFCSGTLVLVNKLTLHHIPFPSLIVSFQLLFTILFIYIGNYCNLLLVDAIQWKYVKPYLYYTVAFSLGVYCNMKSLSISNVETVIVFRATTPCLVAILDVVFLGREYPSKRSWIALCIIILGAYGYAMHDTKFQTQGYSAYTWPFLYLLIISFEMCYGKRIIRSVDLKTQSGPVLYTNLLGLFPFLIFAHMGGEYNKFHTFWITSSTATSHGGLSITAIFFLLLGCITGTGIGYSSWWCRDKVSATSFTLIGVMNKCLTVLLNVLIWDQHAPPMGIASLFLCLIGGSLYQQSPMRTEYILAEKAAAVAADAEPVWDAEVTSSSTHNNNNDSKNTINHDNDVDDEKQHLVVQDGITLRNKK